MTSYVDDQADDLAKLNAEIQRTVDRAAAAKILDEVPTKETIIAWRLSTGLGVAALAAGLRMSRKQIHRIESGETPVNEHFLKQLRPFVVQVQTHIPHIPHHVIGYPLPPRGKVDRYVPLGKVVGVEKGTWRKCAFCQQEKLFLDKRALYCSRRCKRDAETAGRSVGVPHNRSGSADAPTQRKTKCEQCGHVQPIAGHLVSRKQSPQEAK